MHKIRFSGDNLYINLGLLLPDQCLHTLKITVFEGKEKGIFKDRKNIRIQEYIKVSQRKIINILKELQNINLIEGTGKGKNTEYDILKKIFC